VAASPSPKFPHAQPPEVNKMKRNIKLVEYLIAHQFDCAGGGTATPPSVAVKSRCRRISNYSITTEPAGDDV
jgi:hypothetical protein